MISNLDVKFPDFRTEKTLEVGGATYSTSSVCDVIYIQHVNFRKLAMAIFYFDFSLTNIS